jgi:transcription elongation GreA/GreB family factor
MARALLQRRVDDEVSVETPGGQVRLTILDVSYVDPT